LASCLSEIQAAIIHLVIPKTTDFSLFIFNEQLHLETLDVQ
jgi:hypothetical protein